MLTNLKISFIVLMVSVLAACGANKKNDSVGDDGEPTSQTDITRPPAFVKRDVGDIESDPEETISLEEWQKERQQEKE